MNKQNLTANKLFTSQNVTVYDGITDELLTRDIMLVLSDAVSKLKRCYNKTYEEIAYEVAGCKLSWFENDYVSALYDKDTKTIFCSELALNNLLHEICHSLQGKVNGLTMYSMLDYLRIEQQCQTMTYYLYNSVYSYYMGKNMFPEYFTLEDIEEVLSTV